MYNCDIPYLCYAATEEEARARNPNVESITPYTDMSWQEYLNKILSASTLKGYDYKGREVWIFPYSNYDIWVKFHKDKDGDYYDYCEYQIRDLNCGGMIPITWTMSGPEEFWNEFGCEPPQHLPQGYVVTMNKIKKIKPVKFYNKNNMVMWRDKDGYFYYADKESLPNTKAKQEYDMFKDNPNAVLVQYSIATPSDPYGSMRIKWFGSYDEFMNFYNEAIKEVPESYARPSYEIIHKGYRKLPPFERKVILRLPYFNIDSELRRRTPARHIACMWGRLCNSNWFEHNFDINDFLEDIVKIYAKWLSEKE